MFGQMVPHIKKGPHLVQRHHVLVTHLLHDHDLALEVVHGVALGLDGGGAGGVAGAVVLLLADVEVHLAHSLSSEVVGFGSLGVGVGSKITSLLLLADVLVNLAYRLWVRLLGLRVFRVGHLWLSKNRGVQLLVDRGLRSAQPVALNVRGGGRFRNRQIGRARAKSCA